MVVDNTKDNVATTNSDKHLLAMKRFEVLESLERDNRVNARNDLDFAYNVGEGQWPKKIRAEREAANRPCLSSNKLSKYVKQVSNRERDQRLAGKVRPVDDKADVQTAQVIEGLIRQIERASNAERTYTEAGEKAIAGGFGYWALETKELDDSFDQEVFIRRIKNQFNVWLDPDRNYGFIVELMPKAEFQEQFPGKHFNNEFTTGSVGLEDEEESELWYVDEKIRVADYYYKQRYDKTIAQVVNPENLKTAVVELVENEEDAIHGKVTRKQVAKEKFNIVREKKSKASRVKFMKMSGHEILEEGDWAGKDIPIIEVEGDTVNIAGKDHKRSLIRDAKDPQMGYNFWKTHMAETVALVSKAPFIAKYNAIKQYKDMWENANTQNFSTLYYDGNERPQREQPATIPTGAAQMMQIEAGDISDVTGLYEASFGEKSNERTGVAIQARANRSDFSTFHFSDNFGRAIIETVKQLIDIIPKIYDTPRTVRILGEDDAQAMDMINNSGNNSIRRIPGETEGKELLATINTENGEINPDTLEPIIIHNLNYGKYDAVPGVKLMSTRRQEQLEGMLSLAKGSPDVSMLLLPEMAQAMDWPNAQKIADKVNQFLQAQNQPKDG
jgi:hypothetical protein